MSSKLRDFCFVIVAVFLTSLSLKITKNIMIPFILSVFLAFIVQPVITVLGEKLKVGRGVSIFLLCIGLIAISSLLFLTIGASVKQLLQNATLYEERFTTLIAEGVDLVSKFDSEFDRDQLIEYVKQLPIFTVLKTISNAVVKGISDFFLISIFTLFILSGPQITLPASGPWSRVNKSIRTYLLTKFVTSAVTGILTVAILKLIDLDMALMFGLLCAAVSEGW